MFEIASNLEFIRTETVLAKFMPVSPVLNRWLDEIADRAMALMWQRDHPFLKMPAMRELLRDAAYARKKSYAAARKGEYEGKPFDDNPEHLQSMVGAAHYAWLVDVIREDGISRVFKVDARRHRSLHQ
jgi:hypothetical protein